MFQLVLRVSLMLDQYMINITKKTYEFRILDYRILAVLIVVAAYAKPRSKV